MRIVAKKIKNRWFAQFDDGSTESGTGNDAGAAMRELLKKTPGRNNRLDDFKPELDKSGADLLVMVHEEPNTVNGD
jgi:hypothetical protein